MERVIEYLACYQFDYRAGRCHSEKDYEKVARKRREDPYRRIESKSVDRANRPRQESAVDKTLFGHSVIDDFKYPAEKTVYEEHAV